MMIAQCIRIWILDVTGKIYIADTSNHEIRKVSVRMYVYAYVHQHIYLCSYSSILTSVYACTFGDSGPATSALLFFPYGITVDALGNVYIAHTYNYRIRKVSVYIYVYRFEYAHVYVPT